MRLLVGISFIPILYGFQSGLKALNLERKKSYLYSSETYTGTLPTPKQIEDHEVDFVVIGSGIGGLSAAAMLSHYGYSVSVLESHYLPGGVAHTFEQDGFKFDAGPSLWNGMATRPFNPLREV